MSQTLLSWRTDTYVAIIIISMRINRSLRLLIAGLAVALSLLNMAPAAASSANISRAYKSTVSIPNGSLVSLNKSKTDYVEPANTSNGSLLIGVAVKSDDSLLAVNASDTTIQVATSGTASVLVTDLNGPIVVGDQIAVSPFDGVGMKQKAGSRVIGLAQTDFDANGVGVQTETVTDKSGKSKQIHIGFVRVNVGAGVTSTASGAISDANLNALQRIAKSITGHQVATWRVIISLIIVTVAAAALITLTYAAIYGSIISVGRNPLGSHNVFKTLRSVLAMALLTALLAGGTVFLLLN